MTNSQTTPQIREVAQRVLASRKYRSVSSELVIQLAARELAKGRSVRRAVKGVKSQLHQSAAAYHAAPLTYGRWLEELQDAHALGDPAALRKHLRTMLAAHTSTRERLPFLEEFYAQIFAHLPAVTSLLDLACGLNPLARPWMPLPASTPYHAIDIYRDQMDFINRFFALAGFAGRAVVGNVLAGFPTGAYDVVFLLKALPCLEQIDREAGPRLLDQVRAPNLVISFPRRSLGGRAKGMDEFYAQRFRSLWEGRPGRVERLDFPNELVFVVTGCG